MAFCGVAQVVTAHGICHLLGYRHETEEEWNEVGVFHERTGCSSSFIVCKNIQTACRNKTKR